MGNSLKCAICNGGCEDGIGILGKFVCDECEKVLVNLDVNDDRYEGYKDLIKKNIYGDFIIR